MTDFVEMRLLPESGSGDGGGFNYGVAAVVESTFRSAASKLDAQAGSRGSYVTTAMTEFKGHFSSVFSSNATVAASDAGRLASTLRTVAGYVEQMITAAHAEDSRREKNNEWVRNHKDRDVFEQIGDLFGAEAERPNADQLPAPTFPAPSVGAGVRQTVSSGASGGTSSAKPEELRSFVTGSRALDESLKGEPGSLEEQLASFVSSCSWGHIDAAGVISAYRAYLAANGNDASWVSTIAASFEAAGASGAVSTVSDAALGLALSGAGVGVSRSALTITPPQAAGAIPSTGYANDPVNTATGNFIEPETDLAFEGLASALVLSRMYNSLGSGLESEGVFGPGWASVLDQFLSISDEGARWVLADGRAIDFPRDGAGWSRAVGENFWLSAESADSVQLAELGRLTGAGAQLLVVRDNQGHWWAYSLSGAWLGSGSGPGRTVFVTRDAQGAVLRLSHERGRFFDVEYIDSRVVVVAASDGRRVQYSYDERGRLLGVDAGLGARQYQWNDAGLISAVISAAGVVEAENTYDEAGRVILQRSQHGRQTRFAYLPGRVTVVSDQDGTRSNSWIADAKGRAVGVLDSLDQRQSMAYDGHSNLVSLTERDGAVTVHGYDQRGRRVRTVTPEGADLTYGFDDFDRLTTLVTATGSVVEYQYQSDQDRDPSQITDPLGGVTILSWNQGLLTQVVDPVGVRIGFSYDQFGDLIATSNAAGEVARVVRDQAGRPVKAITPSGAETVFSYDGAGVLVSRQDPDGGLWRFDHDGAGRITASIDPLGARTFMEYGANGELIRTTDPLGRTVDRVFDELGNVASTILDDGAQWGFTHDSVSRLVSVLDPAGGVWGREYDGIGELIGVVDPTGVRVDSSTDRAGGVATVRDAFAATSIGFDQYGRPTTVTGEDESAELVTYNAAGQPVELVDAAGGLTLLGRDMSGKVTTITSPTGAVTSFEYDVCGRPYKTTDPSGAVTELFYDADQRISRRVVPGGGVETFEYDGAGRLLARRSPGAGAARYGYDKVGRLTFSQDPWYGTRRFGYNLAGELISTTNGVGGKTRFDYDVRGRLIRITDPSGGVTTRSYTQLDQVDSTTDPLGRVTTATYDAAGRQLSQTDPDGHTTSWGFDAAGRERSVSVDGALVSSIDRDRLNRRVVVTDHSSPDGLITEHELTYDRCGRLIGRARGNQSLTWAYDADGNRTSFTDAHGTTTTYVRERGGRLTSINNTLLGQAEFGYDTAGYLSRAVIADLIQNWVHRDGQLTEHTTTNTNTSTGLGQDTGAAVTLIAHDSHGRIGAITKNGQVTRYGYDDAGQLTTATTTSVTARNNAAANDTAAGADVGAAGDGVRGWEYDTAGRLIRETTPEGVRAYSYTVAGELETITHPDGAVTRYVFDGLGRRVRQIGADGSSTEYVWDQLGHLGGTIARDLEGQKLTTHSMWVDALGELASVDGVRLWWDTAGSTPVVAGIGQEQVLSLPGGVTGIGEAWLNPGWRGARATDTVDPWASIGVTTVIEPTPGGTGSGAVTGAGVVDGVVGSLPDGVGLSATGGLSVAGLDWLGARAYDPSSRGFLSTDPLPPVLGAGWDGNPYAYAGNNPLGMVDPTGLRPISDQDLKAYDGSSHGAASAVGGWFKDNWEYLVGGAAVIAGGILMATGVGGPAGLILIGMGADTIIQKATTGGVNWGEVAISGALGGFSGVGIAAKAGLTGFKAAAVAGASSGGVSGGIQGTYGYYTGPGPHTAGGGLGALGGGVAMGAVTGVAGGALGQKASEKIMGAVTRNAGADTAVMGRSMDYRVHPYGEQHGFATYEALPRRFYNFTENFTENRSIPWLHKDAHRWANEKWINYQMMQGRGIVDIGVPVHALKPDGVDPLKRSPYYNMELDQVAGYPGYRQDFQPSWNLN